MNNSFCKEIQCSLLDEQHNNLSISLWNNNVTRGPTLCYDIMYILLSDRNYVRPSFAPKTIIYGILLHEDENVAVISDQYK